MDCIFVCLKIYWFSGKGLGGGFGFGAGLGADGGAGGGEGEYRGFGGKNAFEIKIFIYPREWKYFYS